MLAVVFIIKTCFFFVDTSLDHLQQAYRIKVFLLNAVSDLI